MSRGRDGHCAHEASRYAGLAAAQEACAVGRPVMDNDELGLTNVDRWS
jgi:hypothetical protein